MLHCWRTSRNVLAPIFGFFLSCTFVLMFYALIPPSFYHWLMVWPIVCWVDLLSRIFRVCWISELMIVLVLTGVEFLVNGLIGKPKEIHTNLLKFEHFLCGNIELPWLLSCKIINQQIYFIHLSIIIKSNKLFVM